MSDSAFREAPIDALCVRVTSGGTPLRSRRDFYDGGTVDWFKTGELNDWYLDSSTERITTAALEETSAKLFPANTVLVAMYGDGRTITTLGMLRRPAATNQACAALIADTTKCEHRFLFYALKFRRHRLIGLALGGAQRNLSAKIIKQFMLPVPDLATQRRIASILSAYDDLIENCQRRIRILEDMARGLYRKWFIHFRFPGADSLPRVDSPLGPIPQGWLGRFADLATIARGTINPAGHADEEFVHFSLPAFDDGQRAVVESGASIFSNKTLVPVPCTLLSKLNPRIPRVWRVSTATLRRAIASTEFLALVANNANTSNFVHATCSSKLFQDRLAALAIGTSTSHQRVKPDSLLDMAVVVPTLTVQRRFAESIRPNLDLAEVLRSKIANLRRTRDLLLPRLMSGQIDLSSLDPTGGSAIPAPAPSLV